MTFPQPAEVSIEEKLKAFDDAPLFMKSLPDDALDNPVVSALQSLAYEGTPDEIAQNFKEQGNEYFKGKRYREALGFYTQGVDAKPTDPVVLEALLCNRAACNLELQNYGSVLKDCSKALALNHKSSKAYYRSALALVALERFDDAIDCCERCLGFDKDNAGVKGVHEKALKLKETKERKEREKLEKLQREQQEKRRLVAAFKERNIIVVDSPNADSEIDYQPHFDPEDPTGATLILPALFLYPQYAQTDIISEFVEDTPFSAHIERMFPPAVPPPSWDANAEYSVDRIVVYAVTHRRRVLKVGKKMTLRDVLRAAAAKEGEPRDGLELKDGCLSFVVLAKGDVEKKWIEDFKKARGT
ncbi:Tetratricopeptide repeat protein 4 -like protein [Phanerochaete sordida]|uniref:Tetratricopeptide repeat protein 4 -like protein n=1 Tax=Phanerochaete sordida TaxID=48140 RepID=A0A9P3FY11_9APHY|nr:Tetratricopeptide repeat protein 4 -like protein [Phanerochaete sordida]